MKKILLVLIAGLILIPLSSFAALTTSEETIIDNFIQRWATQYTSTEVHERASDIISRIDYTFEVSSVNEYTTDILMHIADVLQSYLIEDHSDISSNNTDDSQDTDNGNQEELSTNDMIDQQIASHITTFDENEEVTLLAATQGQVVAELELTARLEPFQLESLTIGSSNDEIQNFVSQAHLYTENGTLLDSDSPNSNGEFSFDLVTPYTVQQGTQRFYIVIDTRVIGYNGTGDDDLISLSLRIISGEATGQYSSTEYDLTAGIFSQQITIQSVLISDVRFVDMSEGARVDTLLTNGENVIAILEIDVADSVNNEINSPRDLDVLLQSLEVQISDTTLNNSASTSLILERLDRNGDEIMGTFDGNDTVTFDFDTDDTSAKVMNDSTAVFRIIAQDVRLNNGNGAVKVEINDVREAITYSSTDPLSSTFTNNNAQFNFITAQQVND